MHKTTGTPKALSLHSEYIKNCDFKLAHKVNTVQLLLWSARRKTNYQLMDPMVLKTNILTQSEQVKSQKGSTDLNVAQGDLWKVC